MRVDRVRLRSHMHPTIANAPHRVNRSGPSILDGILRYSMGGRRRRRRGIFVSVETMRGLRQDDAQDCPSGLISPANAVAAHSTMPIIPRR